MLKLVQGPPPFHVTRQSYQLDIALHLCLSEQFEAIQNQVIQEAIAKSAVDPKQTVS